MASTIDIPQVPEATQIATGLMRGRPRRPLRVPALQPQAPPSLWPSMSAAAAMIGVAPSSLSRRHLPAEGKGSATRLPAHVVLAACRFYRADRLGAVGAAIVEQARGRADSRDQLELLEYDVDAYFDATRQSEEGDDWLVEAKRRLSPGAYAQVISDLGLPG